jgi:NTP-dependent ternary system trypsin peptidase co-occuring protein
MNKQCRFVLLALLLLTTISPAQTASTGVNVNQVATPADKNVVAIHTVIGEIRDALVRVQKELKGKKLPPLASVDLTLKTVVEKDAGGTFKLWIISFGVKREKDQTQAVTIHLTPPSPDNPTKVGAASLTEALESAIVSAAEGAQQSGTDEYPLVFSGLTVDIDFTVKTTGNAKISIPVITPITADISGQVAKNATQTIKIVFQDPKKTDK